jgi:hypothetical protein
MTTTTMTASTVSRHDRHHQGAKNSNREQTCFHFHLPRSVVDTRMRGIFGAPMITARWIKAPTTVAAAVVSAVPPAPAMATAMPTCCHDRHYHDTQNRNSKQTCLHRLHFHLLLFSTIYRGSVSVYRHDPSYLACRELRPEWPLGKKNRGRGDLFRVIYLRLSAGASEHNEIVIAHRAIWPVE